MRLLILELLSNSVTLLFQRRICLWEHDNSWRGRAAGSRQPAAQPRATHRTSCAVLLHHCHRNNSVSLLLLLLSMLSAIRSSSTLIQREFLPTYTIDRLAESFTQQNSSRVDSSLARVPRSISNERDATVVWVQFSPGLGDQTLHWTSGANINKWKHTVRFSFHPFMVLLLTV